MTFMKMMIMITMTLDGSFFVKVQKDKLAINVRVDLIDRFPGY
jgi:hypothetical protein